jgi:hypothetical protein
MNESNLILDAIGLPPESARNCIQELYLVPNGEFKKSINGNILFLESTERRKYKSTISCKDVNSPIVDGLWIGSQINVGCIQNLWHVLDPGKTKVRLARPPVAGSVCVINDVGEPIPFEFEDNEVILKRTYNEKIFVCFRPWLVMKIINFSTITNEWEMKGGWKLELEEI